MDRFHRAGHCSRCPHRFLALFSGGIGGVLSVAANGKVFDGGKLFGFGSGGVLAGVPLLLSHRHDRVAGLGEFGMVSLGGTKVPTGG